MGTRMVNGAVLTLGMLVLVGSAGVMSGCLAAAAGAGAWYAFGEDTMYSELSLAETEAAVKQAFEDGGVTYTGTEPHDDGVMVTGSLLVNGDDQEPVRVGVWEKGSQRKIEVRIGTVSRESAQLGLMGHIQKRLEAAGG